MNRNKYKISRRALLAISGLFSASLITVGSVEASNAPISEVQVGRYQTVMLQPTVEQLDLLSSMVELELPEEINTVGQAVAYLLDGSGYRLLSAKLAEPYRVFLFGFPLPKVQRQLGPLSLRQALELLGGAAFRLVIDPVYRLVTFELVATSSNRESDACSGK